MKILVLAPEIPATSGMPGSPRLFHLSHGLAQRHELHLATRCSSPERLRRFQDDAATHGVFSSVTIVPGPPPTPGWWERQQHRFRRAAHFDTEFLHPRYHREVSETIRALASKAEVDLIYVDGPVMAQYAECDLARPAIIDLHDSLVLLFTRMMRAERAWTKKISFYRQARAMARWERRLHRRFSLIITNSSVDEAVLRRLSPEARTLTVPNGVDTDFFAANGQPARSSKLVFTGVMGYGPNEDAAVYFCTEILPRIRERLPEVEFWAVGSEPTARVLALRQLPGVHVTGEVPDVRPYVASAGVFVCPLRSGAGVKNKILAALAMSTPVVATRLSLDGLDLSDNHDLLVADDAESLTTSVIRLLTDPDLGQRLGQNGRRSVVEKYSWGVSAGTLDEALHRVARLH